MNTHALQLTQMVKAAHQKIDSFRSRLKKGDISEEEAVRSRLELEEEVENLKCSCRKLPNSSIDKQNIYLSLRRALVKIHYCVSLEEEESDNWLRLTHEQIDLHGMSLPDAKSKIESSLRFAARSRLPTVTFIHGYNSGATIRSFLWQLIANNGLPGIIPECSHPNLLHHLQLFENRCYRLGEFETSVPAVGSFSSFVFRSGRTTIPIAQTQ